MVRRCYKSRVEHGESDRSDRPTLRVSDFDYALSAERIAQSPSEPRDAARLLVHDRAADSTQHANVRSLPDLLAPGDLLVVNDTRVRSTRLLGRRSSGGAVEFLLLERLAPGVWRSLAQPAARLRPGEIVACENGAVHVRMLERPERADDATGESVPGEWRVELVGTAEADGADLELLERTGRAPLPPYIRRERDGDPRTALDRERYQTVFAREHGAVAAPTAGLHFTAELLARLAQRGVELARVTLHVGEGTFKPVVADDPRDHRMHAERYELSPQTAEAVARCRARGRRVIAVGTTSVRTLETCADAAGTVREGAGETALFITPGYRFRAVDALLTNFHLPRSTLLMLVSAFAGRERVLRLYGEAAALGYRFYSYGDAMLLL
jgi:S-adenosylmethionine:tRNA ribosyltransferase-isomerase